MRVTFIVGRADMAGGARVVAIHAQNLQRRGHDVYVVARPGRKPTLREHLRKLLRGQKLPPEARESPTHLAGKNFRFELLESYRAVRPDDIPDADVVVATWWETAEWVNTFPESKGAKAYFLQHHEVCPPMPEERVNATWRLPLHKIVVAKWLQDLGREKFGDNHITLVPNSVDLEQFNAPPRGKQAQPTVGVMYSMVNFKGCDIALEAYRLAKRNVPNLKLVAFGTTPPGERMPLPEGAQFTANPPQDKIKDVYAACDAWLFASRYEGFGLPILESMACRTPVIATPAGAAEELIAQGGGVLVPPEDPAAMAAAIEKVCTLPGPAWREMSDKAYRTASRYTWEDATDLFEAALQTAIDRSKAAKPAPAVAV